MLKEELKQVEEIARMVAKEEILKAFPKTSKAEAKKEQTVSIPPDGPSVPDNSPPEPEPEKAAKKEKK